MQKKTKKMKRADNSVRLLFNVDMQKYTLITVKNEYFDIKSTLECGQIFRFDKYDDGFLVYSQDKCAYIYTEKENTVIKCLEQDKDYFYNFFDLDRDYSLICKKAKEENISILNDAVKSGQGIRILNQGKTEMLFSFIISQNNNIPRIKGIINRLCLALGERKEFLNGEYYCFPTVENMSKKGLEFYEEIGLGYRAKYIKKLADLMANGLDITSLNDLKTKELKKELLNIYGVGPKVADCITLFGFHRSDSFPVDTWIEKVYIEDLKGKTKDRAKISEELVERFKENAGYYQQYLFYHKRLMEK